VAGFRDVAEDDSHGGHRAGADGRNVHFDDWGRGWEVADRKILRNQHRYSVLGSRRLAADGQTGLCAPLDRPCRFPPVFLRRHSSQSATQIAGYRDVIADRLPLRK
jgi:hypothetical protein